MLTSAALVERLSASTKCSTSYALTGDGLSPMVQFSRIQAPGRQTVARGHPSCAHRQVLKSMAFHMCAIFPHNGEHSTIQKQQNNHTLYFPQALARPPLSIAPQQSTADVAPSADAPVEDKEAALLREQRLRRRQDRIREQSTYQFAAIAASSGIGALATFATYYRIAWHLHNGDSFPYVELGSTLLLVFGGIVGMEMYARWAHKSLWHDAPAGWALHKSHHEPRTGPFEANDLYALANALPAMGLCMYGFLRPDVIGGLCFGTGLGITLFGISYMFVHDGLVHRRFPVGPIADMPQLRRIAVAHQLHHSEKYGGVPFGLFLGPQELEAVGAGEELDRMVAAAEAKAAESK